MAYGVPSIWLILAVTGVFGYVDLMWQSTNSSVNRLYKQVNISGSKLANDHKKGEFVSNTILMCAMQAHQIKGSHLLCYQDQKCNLYDVKVTEQHLESENDAVGYCYTDLIGVCVYDSDILYEGNTITVAPSCIKQVCENGVMVQFFKIQAPPSSCTSPFVFVPGVGGCIYLHTSDPLLDYDQATSLCETYNAIVVIPDNYAALKDYLDCDPQHWFWVGIKEGIDWNNNQAVAAEYWAQDQPEHSDGCGIIASSENNFLITKPCNHGQRVICQIP